MSAISVIIPAYNAAGTIRACVESASRQSYPALEIIVVDDGSTDDTARIAGEVPGIRVIRKENSGPADARNRGLAEATGDWLAFLDADEEWLEVDKLSRQLACAGKYGAVLIGASGRPGLEREIPFLKLLLGNPFVTSNVLAQKRAVVEAGGFEAGRYYSEDYSLWLRMAARGGRTVLAGVAASRDLTGRSAFAGGGLSGKLMKMQRGEEGNFRTLRQEGLLSGNGVCNALLFVLATAFSRLKLCRRMLIRGVRMLGGAR